MTLAVVKTNVYRISATVKAGSTPLSGVPVGFALRNPAGKVTTYSATSGTGGVATINVRLKGKDQKGTYSVTATASTAGMTGTGTITFAY